MQKNEVRVGKDELYLPQGVPGSGSVPDDVGKVARADGGPVELGMIYSVALVVEQVDVFAG